MPSLSNGKSYAVKAKAADKAGNESPIASDSFTFHSHIPLPFWVWVVIGVAGVLTIGIVLIMLRHRLAKRCTNPVHPILKCAQSSKGRQPV